MGRSPEKIHRFGGIIVFVGDRVLENLAFVWSPTKTIISFPPSSASPCDGGVVPSREDGIKLNWQVFAKRFGGFSFGRIQLPDNMNGCAQARLRGRASHQSDHRVQTVKHHALASTGDLRKETSLNRVVLRTVGWVVSDTNVDTQFIGQPL